MSFMDFYAIENSFAQGPAEAVPAGPSNAARARSAGPAPSADRAQPARSVSDRAILDAVGFGAALLLSWGSLHLMVLASRSALLALTQAFLVAVAAVSFVCVFFRNRSLAGLGRTGAALLIVAGALTAAFAFTVQPFARGLLFIIQQMCASGALACWTLRILAEDGLHQKLSACGGGCAGAGVLGIALYGVASSLGVVGNVTSYTTLALVVFGLAAVACGIVACIWKPLGEDAERNDIPPVVAQGEASSGGASPVRRAPSAQAAMFAAVCLAGAAVWFFDGITFNPYVHDMLSIELIADAVCMAGGALLVACARLRDGSRLSSSVFGCIALFLGLSILGIALVSASMEGAGLPIGLVEGSSVLLLCAAIAHLATTSRPSARLVEAALLCCAVPWAMQVGLVVKRSVGYSLATITPIVLVAIAALSIVSLVLNAQSARSISSLQEGYESELSRQQLDFAAERKAVERRAARQLERERKAREAAVEAVRHEISDRSPKETTSERVAEVLERWGLTDREREVATLAMQGRTITGIGSELGIAKQTVNYHLHNIYVKLGVDGKNEMVTRLYAAANEGDGDDE